jgi:serine/threonine protein kinase
VVKILDMGLARLHSTGGNEKTLTQDGVVVGTPDYLAPEQALSAHTADIRADLYSLGCTLYFLLSGKPPFQGGALAEMLLKHQMEEAVPLDRVRPDVPADVAGVVRVLMAKRPENRKEVHDLW